MLRVREKPVSRQEPRRLKTRAALLAAGLKLLAERNIDGIAVDDIVQRAGVAKGSFFNHFADKDAFAAAIAADIRNGVEARVGATNAGVEDAAQRVAQGICCYVHFALTDRAAAKIFARNATGGPDHPLNRGIRADIALGMTQKRFTLPNVETGVLGVLGIAQVVLESVIGRRLAGDAARALATDLIGLLLSGLGIERREAGRIASQAAKTVVV
jgi:AcrR family transcriptional regulator